METTQTKPNKTHQHLSSHLPTPLVLQLHRIPLRVHVQLNIQHGKLLRGRPPPRATPWALEVAPADPAWEGLPIESEATVADLEDSDVGRNGGVLVVEDRPGRVMDAGLVGGVVEVGLHAEAAPSRAKPRQAAPRENV